MLKKLLLVCAFSATVFSINAQDNLAFSASNFGGVQSFQLNPALAVSGRSKVDIQLFNFELGLANNFLGIRSNLYKDAFKFNFNAAFDSAYLYDTYDPNVTKEVNLVNYIKVGLPGFSMKVGDKFSVGLFGNIRSFTNINKMDSRFAKQLFEEINYTQLYNQKLQDNSFEVSIFNWAEVGVNFGMKLMETTKHKLFVGANIKYLQGINSAYINSNKFNYKTVDDTTMVVYDTEFKYGHSKAFNEYTDKTTIAIMGQSIRDFFRDGSNFSADLGAVYELNLDKDISLLPKSKNSGPGSYSLRFAASIVDIGKVKFENGQYSRSFSLTDSVVLDLTNFNFNNLPNLDSTLESTFAHSTAGSHYYMRLPTALNLNVDYNLGWNIYVNAGAYLPFNTNEDLMGARNIRRFSITPRFETKFFELAIPFTTNNYDKSTLGIALRAYCFSIGSNDIGTLLFNKTQKTFSAYFGLRIPLKSVD